MKRILDTAAIRQCRRALDVPQLPVTELLQPHPKRLPVLVRMLMGVPARGRELARLVVRFASPGRAPLPLDLSLMPCKLLFSRGKSAPQMPLNPRRKAFGIEVRLLFAQLDKDGRPAMGAPVRARAGGSGFVTFRLTGGITGRRGVLRACGSTLAKNNIARG